MAWGAGHPEPWAGVSPPVPFHAQLPHGQWAGRRVPGSRPAHCDQAVTKLTGADSVPALTPGCPLTSRASSGHCEAEGGSLRARPQASVPASCPWFGLIVRHRRPSEPASQLLPLPKEPRVAPRKVPGRQTQDLLPATRPVQARPPVSHSHKWGQRRVPAQLL